MATRKSVYTAPQIWMMISVVAQLDPDKYQRDVVKELIHKCRADLADRAVVVVQGPER